MQSGHGYWAGAWRYRGPMRLDQLRAGRHPTQTGAIYDASAAGTTPYESQQPHRPTRVLLGIGDGYVANPVVAWRRHREERVSMVMVDGSGRYSEKADHQVYVAAPATAPDYMNITFDSIFSATKNYLADGRP
jgi:hypothetical protein